jgi:hypothetical protein
MSEEKQIRIAVSSSDVEAIERAGRGGDVEVAIEPRPEFIDGFSAVLIAGAALLVAKFIRDQVEQLKGGVLIDLRKDSSAPAKRTKEVPYGWVVVLTDDKPVEIEVRDAPKDAAERLLEKIVDGSLKTAADIIKGATKELGAGKAA